MILSLIVAYGKNREIGLNNKLLWHIPSDMKNFVKITKGKPIIVGRKTFESFKKPLPGRHHIVITRNHDYAYDHKDVTIVHSANEALYFAKSLAAPEVVICGGTKIYDLLLPRADRLYLSIVDWEGEADSYFPEIDESLYKVCEERDIPAKKSAPGWKFQVLDRLH